MFGWMPVLYRITSEEVLASAGLDAYAVGIVPFGRCNG
jgi:Late exocytosis, associated with Golgi transport